MESKSEVRSLNHNKNGTNKRKSDRLPSICPRTSHSDDNFFPNAANPLDDPIVRMTLERVQITSSQLINMSVKDLNKHLLGCSAVAISKLKRCRRTLKNRGYAKNCRIKRIAVKNQLEHINTQLMVEIRELKQKNKMLMDQLDEFKSIEKELEATGQICSCNMSENKSLDQDLKPIIFLDSSNRNHVSTYTTGCNMADDLCLNHFGSEFVNLPDGSIVADPSVYCEWQQSLSMPTSFY